jgi:hypothetical protein
MTADRIINGVFCAIGIGIFYWLWSHDILTASLIWKIISTDI